MTALLYPDEAARLRVGERLVIVRAGDPPLDADGVRLSAPSVVFVAPQAWAALTGPCPTCDGKGSFTTASTRGKWETDELPCTDCRDGRRIVPLYTECPPGHRFTFDECRASRHPDCAGRFDHAGMTVGVCDCECHRLVGRGSIEVVPVLSSGEDNEVPRYIRRYNTGSCVYYDHPANFDLELTLDPLPVPGRDWGIVIDCVEVADGA